jgi:hypothetical protein
MRSNRLVWIVGGGGVALVLVAGLLVRTRQPGPATDPLKPLAARNPAHLALLTATEAQRRTALADIVTNSGFQCAGGRGTFSQGMDSTSGDAWWNLDCGTASRYVIRVRGDKTGSSIVMDCRVFEQITANRCFVPIAEWR